MMYTAFESPLRLLTMRSVARIPIPVILATLASAASAASHPPDQSHLLTTVAQVRALTLEQASQRYPLHLRVQSLTGHRNTR